MTVIILMIYALIGVMAGFIGGLLGVGGGLVTVPALLLIFRWQDFPSTYLMQVAIGTSLGAMVFTAISSAWAHYLKNGIDWYFFRFLAPGIILGAILGAVIAAHLPGSTLELIFGFSILMIGFYFLFSSNQPEPKQGVTLNPHPAILLIEGTVIGMISSLLGIGGGIITVPLLMLYRMPIRNAISTSAISGLLIALIGACSFLYLGIDQKTFPSSIGYLYMPAFIVIGITSTGSAPFGAKMAYTLPTSILRRVFGGFLLLMGIFLISH